MKKLPAEFYKRDDVLLIARELLGKILVTRIGGNTTSARITETEAYRAYTDKASHAYDGRRTPRNEAMYGPAGTVYMYICYGMHQLFNVVTNAKEIPDAVLIRAAEPIRGVDTMLERTGKPVADASLTRGPGNMAKALGLSKTHNGLSLLSNTVYIAEDDFALPDAQIGISERIGIDGAGDDALLPYRFYIKGNRYVSGSPVK